MALCSIVLTAAINEQLAAQAADGTAHQADCVHCIDGAAIGAAGQGADNAVA
jgi:hypothetical protein